MNATFVGVSAGGSYGTAFRTGDVHTGNVDGNFIFGSTVTNNYSYGNSQFVTRKVEEYDSDNWVDPPESRRLVEILARHRLLILAGELEDKVDCACHLAYLLREGLQDVPKEKVKVLERCRSKEPQTIEAALDGEVPTILLLTEISPRQFNPYTLSGLRQLLEARKGYAVLTTGNGRTDWGVAPGSTEAELWQELSSDSYYGAPLLREFLLTLLAPGEEPLPKWLLPEGSIELVSGVPLDEVVAKLRTPGRVRSFTEWLLRAPGALSREMIEKELAHREGDEQAVCEWYRQFDARNQLLIVGLTLLDGLPEDLVFTGLELLVRNVWRSSDPNLPQFDYCDLVRFSAYFDTVETEEGLVRIQSSSRKQREQILRVAWDLQRRRLLATLPELTEMIRISVTVQPESSGNGTDGSAEALPQKTGVPSNATSGRAFNRSPEGTLQFHQALVESFSLIGLLSIHVVEPQFLELAADSSKPVRQLAARALSAWRDAGHQESLFELLQTWWAEAVKISEADSRIARLWRRGEDPHAAVRAAVALTVGYSARFDRSNQMDSRLLALAVSFLQDRNPQVRESAAEAVHFIVAWHFRQVEPFLRGRVLQSGDFIVPIATGAAEACQLRMEETLAILDHWRAFARAEKRRSSPHKVSAREHLLAAVALTYGYIRFDNQEGSLQPEVVVANLRSLLMEETHPFVRRFAFYAIQLQAIRNFEAVIQFLQELLSQIHLQDRPAVVDVFAWTYLYQRSQLRGGNQRIAVGGTLYDVWTDSPRPLTDIEAILYGWLLDSSRPIVQQLAVDVFDRLGRTDLEKAERKLPAVPPEVPGAAQAMASAERPQPQVHALPVLGRLAVYCVAPRKPQVRSTLQPLLAEMIALQKVSRPPRPPVAPANPPRPPEVQRDPAEVLFERWGAMPNDATRAVARLLRRAFSLYRWRWVILLAILGSGIAIYRTAPFAVHALRKAYESVTRSAPAPQSKGAPAENTPQSPAP